MFEAVWQGLEDGELALVAREELGGQLVQFGQDSLHRRVPRRGVRDPRKALAHQFGPQIGHEVNAGRLVEVGVVGLDRRVGEMGHTVVETVGVVLSLGRQEEHVVPKVDLDCAYCQHVGPEVGGCKGGEDVREAEGIWGRS